VRIVENGKPLKTVALSPLSPSLYDYKTEPGTHIVTFVYVGPDWLVPTSRVVTIPLR
jgi:hypothetical protein